MKAILVEIGLLGRWDQWKRRLVGLYFCVSFFALCIGDESPLWVIALVVVNFANAARLVGKIGKAISQHGRMIVVDVNMALDLMKKTECK